MHLDNDSCLCLPGIHLWQRGKRGSRKAAWPRLGGVRWWMGTIHTLNNLCTVDQQCIALISYVDIVYQCTQFCAVPKRHGKGADAANAKNVTWPSLTPSIAVMRTGALLGVGFGACMLGLCLMKGTLKPDRLPNRKKNNSLKPRCKWRLWLAWTLGFATASAVRRHGNIAVRHHGNIAVRHHGNIARAPMAVTCLCIDHLSNAQACPKHMQYMHAYIHRCLNSRPGSPKPKRPWQRPSHPRRSRRPQSTWPRCVSTCM